jgi:amino acid adenylation domain-containing protein
MSLEELLTHLRLSDASIAADGDQLRLNAPAGVVTPALRDELAANKPALLALLRAHPAGAPWSMAAGWRAPLSFAQQRMWMLDRMHGASAAYNLPGAIRLHGTLDVDALERAFAEILRRHAVLRTRFEGEADEPMQVVQAAGPFELPLLDLSDLPAHEREARIAVVCRDEALQTFDLTGGPLLRVRLLRAAADDHVLLAVTHHIISDGWSMGVFLHELSVLYAALRAGRASPLPELPLQYADFARWERAQLQGETLERELDFWRGRLAPPLAALDLPMARPRPPLASFAGAELRCRLGAELLERLRALAAAEQSTLFMVLLAAFQTLLYRHSGQTDVLVGTPVANRGCLATEGLIGFFANTLVLRGDLSGNPEFTTLLQQARAVVLDAQGHQALPFDKLVEELRPERDASRNPFFQAMLALQHAEETVPRLEGLQVSLPPRGETRSARFDLSATFREGPGQLDLTLEFNTDLFDAAQMGDLAARFEVLLAGIARDPRQTIGTLPLLTASERERLLFVRNDTAVTWEDAATLPELFARCAQARPATVALSFEGATLSYGELLAQANRLARCLRALGVGPGVLVGLCLEREPRLMVALLGVLASGGAYVPLDPGFPTERLAYMLEDSGATVLLTAGDAAAGVQLPAGLRVLDLDEQAATLATLDDRPLDGGATPDDPAYVIYTSGSTGRPKGVAIPHLALSNFLRSMQRVPGLRAEDVVMAITTISFDIAGLELYLPLVVGARIELVSRETAADGLALAENLSRSGATVLQATPATWRLLLEADWQPARALRAFCGGEPLPRELADQLLARVSELWNLYGPTETTVWSTLDRVLPAPAPVSIGRPIANTQVYVLSAQGEPVPEGIPGELWIGGDGVALGYHRRPELSAERFLPDRFGARPRGRLYRTGDLARWDGEGRLHHLGRLDHQVKVRGFRIELGEIEAELAAHPSVKQALVMARDAGGGDLRLVAYLVFQHGRDLTVSDVRRHLRQRLPDYMIPAIVVAVSSLPLTPNGKIDRAALPDPFAHAQRVARVHVAPAPGLEEEMARIWREVLKVDAVGAEDNFFELGGHSLLSFKVVAAVERNTGWRMDPRILFFQTLRQVAATGAQAGAFAERS